MKRVLLILFLILVASGLRAEVPQTGPSRQVNVYSYRMKGKVRLLFFWVGKDNVGGGTITVTQTTPREGSPWKEEVEVLFGSNPDRVPGQINRWGYGREESVWSAPPQSSGPAQLQSTLFEGFMKHSKEESLKEVQQNNQDQAGGQEFLYDGIKSFASRDQAGAEIRTFSTSSDFRYQDSAPVHCGYQERLKQGGPDRTRELDPIPDSLNHPFGFLTGIQSLIRKTLSAASTDPHWTRMTARLNYVYNGREYLLELRNLESINTFQLPLAEGQTKDGRDYIPFNNVAKAEFRVTNLEKDTRHEFALWIPLEGKFRGIPLRIVDKPRWWLRVELNLEPDARAVPPRSNIDCLDGTGDR